jgi:hypothetical protein
MHVPEPNLLSTDDNIIENKTKKRGRKRKEDTQNIIKNDSVENDNSNTKNIIFQLNELSSITSDIIEATNNLQNSEKNEQLVKKRGRKPKGGKLTFKQPETPLVQNSISNIILHLKCSLNDLHEYNNKINKMVTNPLEYNPSIPLNILTYNQDDANQFSTYDENMNWNNNRKEETDDSTNKPIMAYVDEPSTNKEKYMINVCNTCKENNSETENLNSNTENDVNMKDINAKLKKLKICLYKNQNINKKSACFWCTYDYDNPSCYIPKYEMDGKIYGYGSFCRPECAVAFLMKENIDDSSKFERYHLLNQIYSKIYGFKKNIKPSPNPYYLLEKFYGNLTIQEYRKLLKTEHMLLVIEKPMTRVLPELHEENEDLISNIYGSSKSIVTNNTNTAGVYKVQRQSERQQGPSKSSILRDKFGI